MQYQRHRVVAALVLAHVDGKIHYVYQGGLVPLGVSQERLDDWLAGKLIEEVDAGPVERPTAEQLVRQLAATGVTVSLDMAQAILAAQDSPASAPDETGETGAGQETNSQETGGGAPTVSKSPLPAGAPAESATKPAWVEYAVSRGMDKAEAEKATKADLIAALSAQV